VAVREKSARWSRYRQIAEVLLRHGFGFVVGIVGLDRFAPLRVGFLRSNDRGEAYTRPERIRVTLEELGATFIKLGQILSTRVDLLPPDYQAELAKLQDQAAPVPTSLIEETVVAELGRPIDEVFSYFDPIPLAAASIGQVHAATLRDGTDVVVKVRRPGVERTIEEDLEILQNLAATASRRWELADQYDVVGLVEEFSQTLRAELDYIAEGRNAERFAENFADDRFVHIPRVFWEASSSRVLTLERLHGCKITDDRSLERQGIDRHQLAARAVKIIFKMTFEDGFFHADPHPGNFVIEPDGRIGLMDFGMIGRIDRATRDQLIDLVFAVASQDPERVVDAMLALGVARRRVDRHGLRRDVSLLMTRYYGRALGDVVASTAIEDGLTVTRRHRLQLPPNLAILLKTVVMNEGLGRQIDPTFRVADALAPFAKRLLVRQYSPERIARQVGLASLDVARLGLELPEHVRRIVQDLERGGIEVGMRPEGFEPLVRRFERLANRITLGIIVAAFVNGLAILAAVYRPAGWETLGAIAFVVGFGFAAVVGVYLAWTILRSGRG
jgi:ubiquinone biosynthesis protein